MRHCTTLGNCRYYRRLRTVAEKCSSADICEVFVQLIRNNPVYKCKCVLFSLQERKLSLACCTREIIACTELKSFSSHVPSVFTLHFILTHFSLLILIHNIPFRCKLWSLISNIFHFILFSLNLFYIQFLLLALQFSSILSMLNL